MTTGVWGWFFDDYVRFFPTVRMVLNDQKEVPMLRQEIPTVR